MKLFFLVLSFLVIGCGDAGDKKKAPVQNVNNTNENNANNENNQSTELCGNGVVDPGETCDGDCGSDCDDGNLCTVGVASSGAPESCDVVCEYIPVGCNNDDGCCPPQCTFEDDNDCSESCGDNVIDPDETCDGDCPTSCDDGEACTTDTLNGAAANCTASCSFSAITECINDDGCCGANCTQATDNDCSASCGNGVLETGETCDGDCPTTCSDGNSCTDDTLSGTSSSCNVTCTFSTITACFSNDGCCPAACDWTNDTDCPCTPQTCGQQGLECGAATDGCGNAIQCGGCPANESCQNNVCVANNGNTPVGGPCDDGGDCATGACALEANDWRGGYCSALCTSNAQCPSGSHCGSKDSTGEGLCLKTCASDTQCRNDGYLCYDVDNDNASECFPAGTGAGGVGASCDGSWECGGGAEGWCVLGWPSGYCTRSCGPFNFCPNGASCGLQGVSTEGICHETCTSTNQCRPGYTCETLLGISGMGCVGP